MITLFVILLLSYLVGSIPASVWLGRWFHGVDIRQHGSGNAGATNAFRVLGWKVGIVAMLFDIGKGVLAAGLIASIRLSDAPLGYHSWDAISTEIRMLAGLVAVLGHMFPVYVAFRGGKGVATSAGMLFAITPTTMLITVAVFLTVLFSSRYVSLASILAAVSFPTALAVRRYVFHIEWLDTSLLVFGSLLALGVVLAHRANIRRLLNGTESRVRSFRPGRGLARGGAR